MFDIRFLEKAKKALSKSFLKRLRDAALWRAETMLVQCLWFALDVEPVRIGHGPGPLTWLKQKKHKKLRRKIHVCLLEHNPKGRNWKFGELIVFWINERSRVCSASLNERVEDADIVWVCSQDPLSPGIKSKLLRDLQKARAATPVINHPDAYDSYHEERAFEKLAKAGVSVPRTEFTGDDVGKTWVVYKAEGKHSAPKYMSRYSGFKAGHRVFEFVDSRDSNGLYSKYRAFYVVGSVHPNIVMFSKHWNVYIHTASRLEYTFRMTPIETEQVRLIAKTLGLQYFAVDYLRRARDGRPVVTDINVYPDVAFLITPIEVKPIRSIAKALGLRYFATDYLRREQDGRLVYLDVSAYPKSYPAMSLRESNEKLGYYGRWLTFDRLELLGIPDLSERPFWDTFDEAMLRFSKEAVPA